MPSFLEILPHVSVLYYTPILFTVIVAEIRKCMLSLPAGAVDLEGPSETRIKRGYPIYDLGLRELCRTRLDDLRECFLFCFVH